MSPAGSPLRGRPPKRMVRFKDAEIQPPPTKKRHTIPKLFSKHSDEAPSAEEGRQKQDSEHESDSEHDDGLVTPTPGSPIMRRKPVFTPASSSTRPLTDRRPPNGERSRAKREYRKYPASTKEADLEKKVVRALDSVPLETMRRYYTRAMRFADAYRKGLNGEQAAWAAKKYHGHRVVPDNVLDKLTDASVNT